MSTRRPRVKVAANLSIRRAPKTSTGEQQKTPEVNAIASCAKDPCFDTAEAITDALVGNPPAQIAIKADAIQPKQEQQDEQHFKLPKPVDDVPKNISFYGSAVDSPSFTSYNSSTSTSINNNNNEEPMSPRKSDGRFGFLLPLSRKRNRTESLTSNKSLPEGITVNKVARKVATKQEESQRTQENKKETRKRLTNIDNVNKQNLTMFDMIYYNPINNPMETPTLHKRGSLENIPKAMEGRKSRSVSKSRSPTPAPVPAIAPKVPAQLTPQLKLGPNGEMILDEASLVIENEREKEMRETLASNDIVYQDEFSGNSGYYSRIRRTKDWTNDETVRFYRCLHTIGTDFSMMLTLFPCRTRRDLKLKFKKEERLNLQLVNKALQHPKVFNLDELKQQFDREDEEHERTREEQQLRAEESQRKLRQEKLNKKMLIGLSKCRNPKRRVTKSERAMITDTGPSTEAQDIIKTNNKPKRKRRKQSDVDNAEATRNGPNNSDSMVASLDPVPMMEDVSRDSSPDPAVNAKSVNRSLTVKTVKSHIKSLPSSNYEETERNICDGVQITNADAVPNVPNTLTQSSASVVKATCNDEIAQSDKASLCQPIKNDTINSLALVQIPAAVALVNRQPTTPATMVESLDGHPNQETTPIQPCLIDDLTPVVFKYDGTDKDYEYLPLPGVSAPVARKVGLRTVTSCALSNSGELLMEVEPTSCPKTNCRSVGKQTVAGEEIINIQHPENLAEIAALTNTLPPASESGDGNISDDSVSLIRHKLEGCTDPVDMQAFPKTAMDDEDYPAEERDEDECYVADEPIPEGDDNYCCTKLEDADASKDGYLCETIAEISIGREQVSATAHLHDIPKVEIFGQRSMETTYNAKDSPKQEKKTEQGDITESEIEDVAPEHDDLTVVEDEAAGGEFSMEDIDINSLVLVESQDASEPNKTIYEIYVVNPETGLLSEKPLDVPADVIGNIRAILEADDGGS